MSERAELQVKIFNVLKKHEGKYMSRLQLVLACYRCRDEYRIRSAAISRSLEGIDALAASIGYEYHRNAQSSCMVRKAQTKQTVVFQARERRKRVVARNRAEIAEGNAARDADRAARARMAVAKARLEELPSAPTLIEVAPEPLIIEVEPDPIVEPEYVPPPHTSGRFYGALRPRYGR